MKYARHGLTAILILVVIVPSVWAQGNSNSGELDFMKTDPRVWKGSISIKRTGKAEEHVDNSSQGNVNKRYYSRKVSEDLVLNVCGPLSELYILDMKHSLSDTTEEGTDKVDAKAVCVTSKKCTVWKCDRETRHPGNSRRIRKKTTVALFKGKTPVKMEDAAHAVIQKKPGSRYVISAGHDWYSTRNADSVDRITDACTGKEKVTEQHWHTGSWGEPAHMDTRRTKEGANTVIRTPPVPWIFAMQAEGSLAEGSDVIAGEETSKSRMESHGYAEQVVLSWSLKGNTPCDEVYFDLRFAIAGADAYSNPKLRDFANTKFEYEALINDRISKIMTGRPHTPAGAGQPISEVDNSMATDPKTCKIQRMDVYRMLQKQSCGSPFLYQVILDHEKEHARHCWQKEHDPPFNADPNTKQGVIATGQTETSAHLVEAAESLAWLRENCRDRGYDLDAAQIRIDEIKARKAGWD